MKPRNVQLLFSLLPILILGFHSSSYATHVHGAELGWDYLGNNKYRVKAIVYDNCRGGGTLSNTRISFLGNCSGLMASTQTMSSAVDITPVCPGQCTGCNSGCNFQYGIRKYELVTVLDVSRFKSNGCKIVSISWSQCCRSGSINTGGANQNFHVDAQVDVSQAAGNNSPKFNNTPFVIACLGRDLVFDHGATDRDTTDSLVYSLKEPRTSASGITTWKSPFTYDKPLSYLGFPRDYSIDRFPFGFHLDSSTGILAFRPMKLETSIMAIKVEEYRNGTKIGELSRDVAFAVIKCPNNNPPVISGANCTTPSIKNVLYTCPGQKICFSVCTSDKDKDDTLSFEKIASPPGSVVKITNGKRPKVDFCWTPSISQMRKQPYFLTLKTSDDACPFQASSFRTFQIYVDTGSQFSLTHAVDTLDSLCGKYRIRAYTKDGQPNSAWEWYKNDTVLLSSSYTEAASSSVEFDANINGVQNISVRSTRGGCWKTTKTPVTVSGTIPIYPGSLVDTMANCAGSNLNMKLKASGGTGKLKYRWHSLDLNYGIGTTTDFVQAFFRQTGSSYTTALSYTVTDSNNCSVDASFKVFVPERRVSNFVSDTLLCSDTLTALLPITSNSNGYWSGKGVSNNEFSSIRSGNGTHKLVYFEQNKDYCLVDTAIFNVFDNPIVSAGTDFTTCRYHTGTTLVGSPINGDWSGNFVNSNRFKPSPGTSTGKHSLAYTVTQNGCSTTDTVVATIVDFRPKITLDPDTFLCRNIPDFALSAIPVKGKWSGRHLIEKSGQMHFRTRSAETDRLHELTYYFEDTSGCYNVDTIEIDVKLEPTVSAGVNLEYCQVDTNAILEGLPNGGIWSGKNMSADTVFIDKTLLGRYDYTYVYSDAFGCKNSDEMSITINPLPNVSAETSEVCIQGAVKFHQLRGTPYGGDWIGPFIQSHIPAPTVKLTGNNLGNHIYRYVFTDKNGCSNQDTAHLMVGEAVMARFRKTTGSGMLPIAVDFISTSTIRKGTYTWDFGDGSTSSDENPSHNYIQDGTYDVCLTIEDSTGYCTSSVCDEVTIKSVGLHEFDPSWLEIYPNPANEFIKVKNQQSQSISVAIFDRTGRQVSATESGTQVNLNVSHLGSGFYILKGSAENGRTFTAPFVKN